MALPASPTSPLVELAALSCTRTPCLLSFLRRDGRGSGLTPAAAQRPTPIQQSASLHPTAEGSFPGNERARSPPALLSQPSCSGQAARLRLRHLAAGPRPALCGYHESQPSRLPASEPSRRGRARSPRSHHSRAMTRTGHSLLLSRPRPTCRSSRRRPVRTPCLRSLRRAQTHRPAGGTSGRRRPLRTQPLPSAESCCCPGNERVRSSLSFSRSATAACLRRPFGACRISAPCELPPRGESVMHAVATATSTSPCTTHPCVSTAASEPTSTSGSNACYTRTELSAGAPRAHRPSLSPPTRA